jgi:hypothetical protein
MHEAQMLGENRAQDTRLVIPPAMAFGTLDRCKDLGVGDRLKRAKLPAQTIA